MSKKLDEIKAEIYHNIELGLDRQDSMQRVIDKIYIAGRDEALDWAKKNVTHKHKAYDKDFKISEESIEAGKTAEELQP